MVMGTKELASSIEDYVVNQTWLDDVQVEIEGDPNEVDPLTLINITEKKNVSNDDLLTLASVMLLNKNVIFTKGGNKIMSFVYLGRPGEPINYFFKDSPFLLPILLKVCYGVALKKLTPPSTGSVNGGNQ